MKLILSFVTYMDSEIQPYKLAIEL